MKRMALFVVACFVSLVGISCFADGITLYSDGVTYSFSKDSTQLTVSGTGWIEEKWCKKGNVSYKYPITSLIVEEGITGIAQNAFSGFTRLKDVVLPKSLAYIGDYAFEACSNMQQCDLESDSCEIKAGAFRKTNLPSENGVCYAGKYAVALTPAYTGNVIVKEGTIGMSFYLERTDTLQRKKLVLPKTLTYFRCVNDARIVGSSTFMVVDVFSENLVRFEWFSWLRACAENVIFENGVKKIPSSNIPISNGITWLGGVSNVVLPNSVTTIGEAAFYGCSGLTSINIPNSVTTIGEAAFYGCSGLTSINIPNSVTTIGEAAFENCNFQPDEDGNIYADTYLIRYKPKSGAPAIKAGTRFIGRHAFSSGNMNDNFVYLNDIFIPESVISIGYGAFQNQTYLKSITFPSTLKWVGKEIFGRFSSNGDVVMSSCKSLESICISSLQSWCKLDFGDPHPLYFSGKLYLNGNEITDLVVPEGVDAICHMAFYGQKSITSVTIPSTVRQIGTHAFEGTQVRSVISRQTNPQDYADAFSEVAYLHCPLYVPEGSYWDYVYNSVWGKFAHIKEYAVKAQDISSNKVYMIADARGFNYSVYDKDKGALKSVEYAHSLDEESADNCWQVVRDGDRTYLYNVGARQYAAMAPNKHLTLTSAPVDMDVTENTDGLYVNGTPLLFVLTDAVPTAVDAVSASASQSVKSIYTLDGTKAQTARKGVNVFRYTDGSSRKVMVK